MLASVSISSRHFKFKSAFSLFGVFAGLRRFKNSFFDFILDYFFLGNGRHVRGSPTVQLCDRFHQFKFLLRFVAAGYEI